MSTKVTADKMLPSKVSLSESTKWVKGPMTRPIKIRNNTSGMRRLLKMELKR